MTAPLLRLGDEIDDYCPRCKLLLNHAVASMVGSTVVKVVCQTCHSEHPYKNAEVPPKKKSGPTRGIIGSGARQGCARQPGPRSGGKTPGARRSRGAPQEESAATPARYITRHATRPPRGKH